eukprot:12334326-Karenia_brevis.AAC.1
MQSLLTEVADVVQGSGPLRVVHSLTGDGINTNEAAAKRVFAHYSKMSGEMLLYFLVVWRCTSHQANLVVAVAICGKLLSKPLEQDTLCENCSRFFKYLLCDHCDDFAFALRQHIAQTLVVREYADLGAAPQISQATLDMQTLYGRE